HHILGFVISRLLKSIVVILVIVVLSFLLVRLAPGDAAQIIAGEAGGADQAYLDQLRQEFGLDKPLLTQLWIYLKGVAQLDLGFSYRQRLPVLDLLLERLPATLLLTGGAYVVALS